MYIEAGDMYNNKAALTSAISRRFDGLVPIYLSQSGSWPCPRTFD